MDTTPWGGAPYGRKSRAGHWETQTEFCRRQNNMGGRQESTAPYRRQNAGYWEDATMIPRRWNIDFSRAQDYTTNKYPADIVATLSKRGQKPVDEYLWKQFGKSDYNIFDRNGYWMGETVTNKK